MPRNPDWSHDELLLALDLFFRFNPLNHSLNHPDIVELGRVLDTLAGGNGIEPYFRNRNSVYMKLCNFLRFAPDYKGVGLRGGSQMEEVLWKKFFDNREHLHVLADAIKANAVSLSSPKLQIDSTFDDGACEGGILLRQHRIRERNSSIVHRKKLVVLQEEGSLKCEVCAFDFAVYGPLGEGYIECHHIMPLFLARPGDKTRLRDLALVCSNCHRMLHRGDSPPSLAELRLTLSRNAG